MKSAPAATGRRHWRTFYEGYITITNETDHVMTAGQEATTGELAHDPDDYLTQAIINHTEVGAMEESMTDG